MISGMIELLTPHYARGWAYDVNDQTAPLMVRARHRETVLAQIALLPPAADNTLRPRPNHRVRGFCIEFAKPTDRGSPWEIQIEASPQIGGGWYALPRYLKIGAPFNEHQLPQIPEPKFRSACDPEVSGNTPFWSDDPSRRGAEKIEDRPVFVLGAARSGTTALCLALEKGTRYRGFPEGHVLDVAIRIVNAVNAHFEKKDPWISPEDGAGYLLGRLPHARFRDEAIELLRRLVAGYTTRYWFDKTPTYQMIASVPILAQAWRDSRFIFMKRRGLENLRSRLRKFTNANFIECCRDWNIVMTGWRIVRDTIPGRFIELDQRTLVEEPDSTSASVGQLLGLEPEEVEGFAAVLRRERPESTGLSESFVAEISDLGWSENQIETFRQICGAEMEAYGYTYDADYCSSAPGPR